MDNITLIISQKIKSKTNTEYDFKISTNKSNNYDYSISNALQFKDILDNLEGDYEFFTVSRYNNFFNIKLSNEFVCNLINNLDFNQIVKKTQLSKNILIDYSSPNVAKEMHVGHLRSTIIGDSLANFFESIGHNVMRINHIGDFGLQFGMMVNYIIIHDLIDSIPELNLQELYEKSNKLAKESEQFASEAQLRTYQLQNGIEPAVSIHNAICTKSREHFNINYSILNIKGLEEVGESFYQKLIPDMVKQLEDAGILEEDEGRKVVRTVFRNKPSLITIIKSNNGYTYDTTDLCALKYRANVLKADKILYVVDSGQAEHLEQVFQVGEKLGWIKPSQTVHVGFGLVLDEKGKRIKSRDGSTLKLLKLFEETIEETSKVIKQKNSNLSDEDIKKLAIGSIKYADLRTNRLIDYKFSYEKMLSFTGNTLCYIMYGYIRAVKILEKYLLHVETIEPNVKLEELNEKDFDLIKFAFKLPEYVEKTESGYEINNLCVWAYELVERIQANYKSNRVLNFDSENKLLNYNNSRAYMFKLCVKSLEYVFKVINVDVLPFM
jgi:arginyl-tRNA synthetase